MPQNGRSNGVNLQSFLAQTRESRPGEFRGAAATGGGVDDGEETVHLDRERTRNANSRFTQSFPNRLHNCRIPASPSSFPRRSASTLRLLIYSSVLSEASSH